LPNSVEVSLGCGRHRSGEAERFFRRREADARPDAPLALKDCVRIIAAGQGGNLLSWDLNRVVPGERISGARHGRDLIESVYLMDDSMRRD
jgi:hypothetical protein